MTAAHYYTALAALDTLLATITGLGSHALGGRPDVDLSRTEYPAIDIIHKSGSPSFWPAGVVENAHEATVVGRIHGQDPSALSALYKATVDKIATDPTLGGLVIDVRWGAVETDEGAFDHGTFWMPVTFWFQRTYGAA